MASTDEKVAEQVFQGSLAILAVLIAVVGLVAAAQDKVSGISYLAPIFEGFQWFIAGLSVFSGISALLALSVMRGGNGNIKIVAVVVRVLIVATVLATLGFVWIS